MLIQYFNECGDLIANTEDYVPSEGETVIIDNIPYEVRNKSVKVSNSTLIEVDLAERF